MLHYTIVCNFLTVTGKMSIILELEQETMVIISDESFISKLWRHLRRKILLRIKGVNNLKAFRDGQKASTDD